MYHITFCVTETNSATLSHYTSLSLPVPTGVKVELHAVLRTPSQPMQDFIDEVRRDKGKHYKFFLVTFKGSNSNTAFHHLVSILVCWALKQKDTKYLTRLT